jgi:hypothetical protein
MRFLPQYALAALLLASAAPTFAEWVEMPAGTKVAVAKGTISVTPQSDWNRSTLRPSKRSEAWTRDGINLNELTFYGAIADGESVLRQGYATTEKLPRFKSDMLPTDIAELFEATSRMVLQSSVFKLGKVEPAKLGGYEGVRFGYTYAVQDEDIERRGEATAVIVDGRLYLVNYVAPSIHYFDAYLPEVRAMIEGATLTPPKAAKAADPKAKKKGKMPVVMEMPVAK